MPPPTTIARRAIVEDYNTIRRVASSGATAYAPDMGATTTLRRAGDVVRALDVLRRRGLLQPARPDRGLRALRSARRGGPVVALVAEGARERPEAFALSDERESFTFAELDRRGNALARGLTGLGLRPGDRVALFTRDHADAATTLLAAGKAGLRVVLLNTDFGRPQLADVVEREQVSALVLDEEFLPIATGVPEAVTRVVAWTEASDESVDEPTVAALVAASSVAPVPLPERPGGLVLLTSGTTGRPRGASRDRFSPLLSAQLLDRVPWQRGGALVLCAPLSHGTGFGHAVMALGLGKRLVLRRRFDPVEALRDTVRHRADAMVVVPTMLHRIVNVEDAELIAAAAATLRVVVCAGSALSSALCQQASERLGDVLYNVYGSTEVANVSIATPDELRRAPGTVGRQPVGCRVALLDSDRREVVEPGAEGAIFVGNMAGFARYTEGSSKEAHGDMLATGDVGHWDADGLLHVDGRTDDMVVSGGENVFPEEVEHVLARRDDVLDVAVIGVPDQEFGQRLRAFVVPRGGQELDSQELRTYVRDALARHKVPRDVVVVDELPRNATGKLLRNELRRAG
jgi:fatty-acyl-CoA synthase